MAANRPLGKAAGYRSPRQPKLRGKPHAKSNPPAAAGSPESAVLRPVIADTARARDAEEAALDAEFELMDEATDEAVVTIVEIDPVAALAGYDEAAREPVSRPRPMRAKPAPSRNDPDHLHQDDVPDFGEEAIVEIVELPIGDLSFDERDQPLDTDNPPSRRTRCRPQR